MTLPTAIDNAGNYAPVADATLTPGLYGLSTAAPLQAQKDNSVEDYKVHYYDPLAADMTSNEQQACPSSQTEKPYRNLSDPVKRNLQEEFFRQDGREESIKVTQLQILKMAQEKDIEKLKQQLESVEETLSKEIRILKHELSRERGQKECAKEDLTHCQQKLEEAEKSRIKADGQIVALEQFINALKVKNEELTKKNLQHESTIESLRKHLEETESRETWTKLKQDNETNITMLNSKYETNTFLLKQEIDKMSHEIEIKDKDICRLKKQVSDLTKNLENTVMERANTMGNVNNSLNHIEYNQLLQSGIGQEVTKLRSELQDALAGKNITENLNQGLQAEISDLRKQVVMFESAVKFGIISSKRNSTSGREEVDPNDSYAQLGIRNLIRKDNESLSDKEMVIRYKSEFERSFIIYREKCQKTTAMKAELETTQSRLNEANSRLESTLKSLLQSQNKVKELEASHRPGGTIAEKKLERELERISKEKDQLVSDIRELQARLEEANSNAVSVNDQNQQLCAEMLDMRTMYDEEMRKMEAEKNLAIERHYLNLDAHQETVLQQRREEVMQEAEEKLQAARMETDALERELMETKQLYIEVCKTKDCVEDTVNSRWQIKLQEQLDQLKQKMISEKKEEVKKLRLSMETKVTAAETEKNAWFLEQQKNLEKVLKEKLLKIEENMNAKHKDEMKSTTEALRRQMEETFYNRMEKELQNAKVKCEIEIQGNMKSEIEAGIARAKEEWKTSELGRWKEEELQLHLKKAKDQWLHDDLVKGLELAEREWAKNLEDERYNWRSKILPTEIKQARMEWEMTERSAIKEEARKELGAEMEIRFTQAKTAAEKDWRERLRIVEAESSRQMAGLETKLKEDFEKVTAASKAELQQKADEILRLKDKQMELEKEVRVLRSQITKLNGHYQSDVQAKIAACQVDFEKKLNTAGQENEKLHIQLQTAQHVVFQVTDKYEAEIKTMKEQQTEELKAVRIEKETGIFCSKEKKDQRSIEEYQKRITDLDFKLTKYEHIFENLEDMTQERLKNLEESLKREHATTVELLEAKLIERAREKSLALNELKKEHDAELNELMENRDAELNDLNDQLEMTSKKKLEEMSSFYLQKVESIKEQVNQYMQQVMRSNAGDLKRRLIRERQRTATNLRRYYLQCLDKLLQNDFDSSYRNFALLTMQGMLDLVPDERISHCNSPSAISEHTTPRENIPTDVTPTGSAKYWEAIANRNTEHNHVKSPSSTWSTIRQPAEGLSTKNVTHRKMQQQTSIEATSQRSITPKYDPMLSRSHHRDQNVNSPSNQSSIPNSSSIQNRLGARDGYNQDTPKLYKEKLERSQTLKQDVDAVDHSPDGLSARLKPWSVSDMSNPNINYSLRTTPSAAVSTAHRIPAANSIRFQTTTPGSSNRPYHMSSSSGSKPLTSFPLKAEDQTTDQWRRQT